ncbi:helix-turn-helix domain-containing protein [Rhodococcus fascians]|nr:helix-turn-helix domain-containing protein [Rhodococcus fascians]MBY4396944.1 helix-turn-helix domain-containing protein [Rhodococcus fascians]MBY4407423.1 helix-turn-helix domain-containing protein [Rhodococcus fascians]MBY4421448.1 helix-turn-helix domain-containing protein [Rhodococcus fascians]MBY4460799.1 helix-turn-helix domain-containing protein [Rhodococcus fascians]
MSALSELLKSNRYGIEARQAAAKAADLGVDLKQGTIAGYFAGTNKSRPSEKTMKALAEVLEIPLEKIREAAGVPIGETDPYMPPPEANRLSLNQRQAIDQLIRAIVRPVYEVEVTASGEGTATATVTVVGESHEDTSTQDTPRNPPTDGEAGPRRTPNTRAGNAGADKPDALISGDQGSRDDYDLARRTGITEYEWRMANEPQPENENQDTGTNDPA